jgi:putative endonuclease
MVSVSSIRAAIRRLFGARLRDDRELGASGEAIAARYLQNHGYRLLERNWRCGAGEIDIIGWRDQTCVFVEVKSSYKLGVFAPEARVRQRKQAKLRKLARIYLKRQKQDAACRFDVISVWWENDEPQLKHFENAF